MLKTSSAQGNERNRKKYDDEPYDDAHDVLSYAHTLLPTAENLVVNFYLDPKSPFGKPSKGTFYLP